jgi:saccharopine dehydrogenase (NADP+, L-glutamate forming)
MTHRDFISSFLDSNKKTEDAICSLFGISTDSDEMKRLAWSGFFTTEKIGLEKGTPAQLLEHILNKKWKLNPGDKDFIVMWHRFKFSLNGNEKQIQAWLTTTGEDEVQTAMAKTVGLPLAVACRLLLQNKLKSRGVVIPIIPEIYEPVLHELKTLGISLTEKETE